MASAWFEEDSFACSVCLETLKEPTTLPCGHSYCLVCIQRHWDQGDGSGQSSCPQCRQVFHPRPTLAKSTLLAEAMEKLRSNSSIKQGSMKAASSAAEPVYLEVLPETGTRTRTGSIYPQLPSVEPQLCHQHQQPLELFCHEDRECVCVVCCQHGHAGHHVLKPQEERASRQKELVQMQMEVQRRIQESEKMLKELPPAARQHKALLQALQKETSDLFPQLVQSLNQTGSQIGELLSAHETSFCSRVEGLIQRLDQEVVQLHWRSEELSRLEEMPDHVCFLKNFLLMEPLDQAGVQEESVLSQEEVLVASIRSTMKEMHESIQQLCRATSASITRAAGQDPVTSAGRDLVTSAGRDPVTSAGRDLVTSAGRDLVTSAGRDPATSGCSGRATPQESVDEGVKNPPPLPSPPLQASAPPPPPPQAEASGTTVVGLVNPEPKTRAEMLKYRFEPTFDPNTVYRHMKLSDDGHKVTMRSENLHPPDRPERFLFWRQVLCKEPLAGSPYYWEVEWTGQKITIGVAYKEMERRTSDDRSRLGHNALSWSLYWSGKGFSFWHDNQEKLLGSPKAKRVGVYLDQHAGVLNFYNILANQAVLIHHHQAPFSGPLYPGFRLWAGIGDTLSICQLD